MIDLSAYHLQGPLPVITGNANGDAVILLPPAPTHASQITLVGVHPQDLTASDFHL